MPTPAAVVLVALLLVSVCLDVINHQVRRMIDLFDDEDG
jgi:hypothetical protein